MSTCLERLLHPRSIAVIGGGIWGENLIRTARGFGFSGPIWPVHPGKPAIAGETAFPSISALPDTPDATFIAINRHAAIGATRELAALGAGGAVCFASGFLEARTEDGDSADLQVKLVEAANGMPLLGPNCYGYINALDGAALWPDQHGCTRCESGVAIITQSSNMALNITMQRRALPLAMVITAGNQAQIGLAEIGAAVLADPRITALGLHIEGVGNIRALEALAETAHSLGKPIIALKVGRSAQARIATVSHTASLAGSEAGATALLARLGIAQARNLPAFLEALKLLHVTGPLPSRRLVSLSCSGGEASLMADLAAPASVCFPPLGPSREAALRKALGPMVALANPLDYHTYIWGDAQAMAATFTAAAKADTALALVVADFPRADRCSAAAWNCVIEAATAARAATGTPFGLAASLPENMPEDVAETLMRAGIVPLGGLQEALEAAGIAADCAPSPPAPPALLPRAPKNPRLLGEAEAKAALAGHGLPVPRGKSATNADELAQAATALRFPLVLKGAGLAHKTEAGAVALGLANIDELLAAAAAMEAETFLLEEMVSGVVAELLLGIVLDEAHGYVLTIGAGGLLGELIRDTQSLLLPTTAGEIEAALARLRICKLLEGYRGAPAADIGAICDAALALQSYVLANHGAVAEVEINPLLALPNGAVAADALIRQGEKNE